jgi:hypothetical protein
VSLRIYIFSRWGVVNFFLILIPNPEKGLFCVELLFLVVKRRKIKIWIVRGLSFLRNLGTWWRAQTGERPVGVETTVDRSRAAWQNQEAAPVFRRENGYQPQVDVSEASPPPRLGSKRPPF